MVSRATAKRIEDLGFIGDVEADERGPELTNCQSTMHAGYNVGWKTLFYLPPVTPHQHGPRLPTSGPGCSQSTTIFLPRFLANG